LVTGASRGIGAAIAQDLAARGFSVCINHSSSDADAKDQAPPMPTQGRGEPPAHPPGQVPPEPGS
jgi:3-oxoacyl-[acyl-carrier protein] reductase